MSLLAAVLLQSAVAADAPPPPPLTLEQRRYHQARDLRTAGVVASIAGPPVAVVGLVVLVAGSFALEEELAVTGFVIGTAGALASVTGPALILGGGSMAAGVARREHGLTVEPALAWVAGGLFVGSVAAGLLVLAVGESAFLWTPFVLYGGGVATSWVWANRALGSARGEGLTVLPRVRPGLGSEPTQLGLVVTGRF